jgi:hypothetical protein
MSHFAFTFIIKTLSGNANALLRHRQRPHAFARQGRRKEAETPLDTWFDGFSQ